MLIVMLTINSPSFKKINMNVIIKSIRLATGCFLYVRFFCKLINMIYFISSNAFASCANCSKVNASPLIFKESPQVSSACSICSLEK